MEKSYEYRLYPNQEQEQLLACTFGCVRWVYNFFLESRINAYKESKKSLSYCECSRMLTELKKQEDTAWLSEVEAATLQQSLRDLDRAYKNFFRTKGVGFPSFKKKKSRKTYRTPAAKTVDKSHVQIPKVGRVKARITRPVEGRIVSATIKQVPSGKYFIVFTCTDIPQPPKAKAGKAIGINLGIASLVTTSSGEKIESTAGVEKLEGKVSRHQRRLSRKKRGSRNWEKQRVRLAKVYEKIVNKRKDYLHKVTAKIVSENQVICAENLDVAAMFRNPYISKKVARLGLGTILGFLEYKARFRGKIFIQVDRDSLSFDDCDINAAKNILMEGMRILNGTEGHSGTTEESSAVTLVE